MQVHVVTTANAHLYRAELEQFYRERHKIYAEELGWVPEAADGLELDQFDTEHAHYLIGVDEGRVITGSRFNPTHLPHMLSEVFPNHCTRNGGLLRDRSIAEWTRGFVVKDFREGLGVRLKAQFCHAVMEYMLDQGVTRIGGIQEVYWLALWRRFKWAVSVHGEPTAFGTRDWVPAYFDVSDEALAGAARWGKLETGQSILVRRGPQKPFISDGLVEIHGRSWNDVIGEVRHAAE
jgi:acyl-homoserine lactone synthase